jgi:hypothetical protein
VTTPSLVSLTQAKDHLRIDSSAEDSYLGLMIRASSAAVLNYIRSGADLFTDSAGDVYLDSAGDPIDVPEDVQAATLLLLGFMYRNRDENPDGAFERGYLPMPVTALLYPYRDPVAR